MFLRGFPSNASQFRRLLRQFGSPFLGKLLQKREKAALITAHPASAPGQLKGGLTRRLSLGQGDKSRMNIGFSGDGGRIAQMLGHEGEKIVVLHGVGSLEQPFEGKGACRPGAEILGREIAVHRLPDILVHIAGIDRPDCPVLADILKEMLARQILHALDEAGETAIGDAECAELAGLGAEPQGQAIPAELGMTLQERGGAEAPVRASITFIADPDAPAVKQPNDRGQSPLFGQASRRQIHLHSLPDPGQRLAKFGATIELFAISICDEIRMVAILPAPFVIDPHRQNMGMGLQRKPGVAIGRGQADLL